MTESSTMRRAVAAFATVLGGYALLGGFTSFLGWPLDIPRLTDWFNDDISIQPNACVLIMLSGAALVLVQRRSWPAVTVLGALVGLGGALILLQYIVGADFRFNHQLLFGRTWGQGTTLTPGRVGPPASTSFTLTGIALMILAQTARQPGRAHLRRFVPLLGVAICVIMAFSLLGFLFGAEQFYAIPWLTAIALQTATMLFAVALGLILSVPEHQPMLLLRENSGAGALARLAIPALVVMIPLVLLLRIWGYEQGHYDLGTGRALGALTLVMCTVALIWSALIALRRHEQALRDSEVRHRTLFEVGSYGVIIIDARGIIESVNPAAQRLFGYSSGEMIGMNATMLIPEPHTNAHGIYLGNSLSTTAPTTMGIGREVVGRRKDGSTFPMDLAVSEFRLGQQRYVQAIVSDISQRKVAEHALREADRRKDEFLATLAHELRNPLAPVMNSLEILDRFSSDEKLATDARAIIRRQMKQMVRLIDDLLDVSRISRGTVDLRKERVELQSVVYETIESIGSLCEAAQQKITVDLPAEPVWVEADPVRLAQIVGNLLSNAFRYSDTGAGITIRASREGGDVILRVKDRGIGIPPDKLETIFEMFSQLDRPLERTAGGLGIGLYLVRRLAEMHGGTVAAHSEGPGKGSEFIVRLPAVVRPPSLVEPTAPPHFQVTTPPIERLRVLVVDDNSDAARTLAMLLRAHGYVTQTAHDGLQAVEAAEQFDPHMILLDIGLPGLNGYEACEQIRSQSWGKDMVLVALTGWGQEEDKRRAQESGFNAHVVKPVEPRQLMQLLASLAEAHDRECASVASAPENAVSSKLS